MAGLGQALIEVGADTSRFEESLLDAIEGVLDKNKFAAAMGTAAAAGVAAVITQFVPLEKAILEIFQVSGVQATDALFSEVSARVLEVSSEVGKSAEQVGAAVALGIGRGFSQEESLNIAKEAGDLSVALGEDLASSAKAVTAALNGFNLEASQTERVAGVLFQTVAKSGIPMSQLAQQIGNIAPVARNAGVSLEDAAAAITTMVQQGISAAEATTQIRTAMTELSRSGSDGGKVFQSIAGKTFPAFIKEGHTLGEALALIQAAADKSGFSVGDLTGNYNTQNAVVGVAVNGLQNYTKNLYDGKKGVEDLDDAVVSANQGALRNFQIIINDLKNGLKAIGVAIRPVINAIVVEFAGAGTSISDFMHDIADALADIDPQALAAGVKQAADFIQQALAPVGRLVVAVFNLLKGLDWASIWAGVKGFATPFLATILAISAAVGVVADAIEFLTPAFQGLVDFLGPALPVVAGLAGAFVLLNTGLVPLLGLVGRLVAPFLKLWGIIVKIGPALVALWATPLGPLIIITAAVVALVVAFVLAWKKFEGFRKVVIGGLNAIKDGVATGVEFMVTMFAKWYDFLLSGIEKILRAAGKLPGWAGGGKFDRAAEFVAGLRSGIQSMVDKVHDLADAVRDADLVLTKMLSRSEAAAQAAAHSGQWFGNAETDQALRDALKGFDKGGGGGGGGGNVPAPNTSGLDELLNPSKTKKAAADVAKQMRDLLSGLFKDIQKFARDIGEMSVDSIESGFEGIIDKFNDNIATAAEAGQKKIVAQLKSGLKAFKGYEKQLLKLATKRDVVSESLKENQQILKDLTDESDRFEAQTKAAFVNLGNVSEASAGIGVTFRGIRNNLRAAIRDTGLFNSAIKELQALGLDERALRQLADAGPAALAQARTLARSGAGGIAEINTLFGQLDDGAAKVADRLADDFFNAGIASANGIVKGLQKELPKIIAEMEKVADAMVNTMKKKLKSKSPSKVFEELGMSAPQGATIGVRRGIPELVKAVEQMSAASTSSANFGQGSVQINGVSDPAAARRAGILAGEAIAQTLQKRATAQTLAGVR